MTSYPVFIDHYIECDEYFGKLYYAIDLKSFIAIEKNSNIDII